VGGYILIIEDEVPIQQFLSMALSREGYEVAVAPDGAAALDVIAQRDEPGVILLDIWMPTMDGNEFLRTYRSKFSRNTPIIVMTADHITFTNEEELAAIDGILIKPFSLDAMFEVIERHMQRVD
jgi:two-component system, OmpR family, response regulator MprA